MIRRSSCLLVSGRGGGGEKIKTKKTNKLDLAFFEAFSFRKEERINYWGSKSIFKIE